MAESTLAYDDWLRAVGLCVLNFSFVEIEVVSTISTIAPDDPSYMQQSFEGRKTAGQVREDFKTAIGSVEDANMRSALSGLQERFGCAIKRRNDLLHAIPASIGVGLQLVRLRPTGTVIWTTVELENTAAEFEQLATDLGATHFRLRGDSAPMTS